MTSTTVATESIETNKAFSIEQHGFDYIPEAERNMTARETTWFWLGANANLFFVSVGAIALAIGLTVWQALIAVFVGNALFALVAVGSIGGVRSGLPTLTFSRAPFGIHGNRFHGVCSWLTSIAFEAINTVLAVFAVVALFAEIGWHSSGSPGKIIGFAVVLAISAGAAFLGHATMVLLQRVFAYALIAVLAVVFFYTIGGVNWNSTPEVHLSTGGTIALVLVGTAIIASGPLSYLFNCADFVRYLPAKMSSGRISGSVFTGAASMATFLCVMGVLLASRGDMSDPVAGVKPFVPEWLFLLYIIAAIGGLVANNVLTFYASGLVLQSVGVPLRRYQATAVDAVVSSLVILYVLFLQDNFLTTLNDFVILMIIWIAPFGAIWIVDGLLRRWHYDPVDIHAVREGAAGRYWGWHGINLRGVIAWICGAGAGVLTINAPILQGPVSRALSGADLSWILAPIVGAVVYYALAAGPIRREAKVPGEHVEEAGRLGERGTIREEEFGIPATEPT
jgi:nucleobase:cation symporter-1, NCS1 family